jgi:hypothetical protein
MRVFTRPIAGASQGTGANWAVTWADPRRNAAAHGTADRMDMGGQDGGGDMMIVFKAVQHHRMASPHVTMRLSSLPQFKSLLVHGPYNPSAPIHLSLSVPPPHHTLLFTPSRHSLLQALQTHDDEWLNTHSGTGTVAGMSSRVTVLLATRFLHVCTARLTTSSAAIPLAPNTSLRC